MYLKNLKNLSIVLSLQNGKTINKIKRKKEIDYNFCYLLYGKCAEKEETHSRIFFSSPCRNTHLKCFETCVENGKLQRKNKHSHWCSGGRGHSGFSVSVAKEVDFRTNRRSLRLLYIQNNLGGDCAVR